MLRRFQSLALLAAICLLSTCGPMMAPELSVVAAPKTIDGNNQKARITVAALDEEGKPGTGTVRLTTTAGTLEEEQLILSMGEAQTMLTCNRALDATCTGTVRVSGSWTSKRGMMTMGDVVITITPPPVDAGVDAGFDAGFDAGPPMDAGNPYLDAGVTLDAGRYTLFIGAQDSIPLAGTFFGTSMVGGEALQFSTTSGLLRASADAGSAAMITVTTNGTGGVNAELIDAPGQMPMMATVTLTHPPSGRAASVGVDLVSLRQVSHVSTTCGGMMNCTLIYPLNSGNANSAQVTFRVVDGYNRPAAGVRVNFSLNGVAQSDVVLSPTSGVTNAMGEVTTTVRSGNAAAVFRVHATVVPGQVEGDSLDIAVRGGTPSSKGVIVSCATINVPGLKTPAIPLMLNCSVRLVDRSNNPVGTGVIVNLLTEAGTVTSTVATQAYMPNGMNEGYANFVVSFNGAAPADVTPLPALSPQFPNDRQAEPSRLDGAITRNPRDGLVTIVVSVIGEEHFDDNNGNGVRDANEPFVDQGEPFVDANDNDIWDTGEIFVNDVDNNGMWTPPNGVWDSAANNHLVWGETKVLLTSNTEAGIGTIEGPIPMLCPGGLPKGTSVDLDIYAPDRNLNRVEQGSTMTINRIGSRGTITIVNGTVQDGFGFEYERALVDAVTPTQGCSAASTRCVYRSAFYNWSRGRLAGLRVTGTALTDMTPCADEASLTITTTVRGTPISTNPISFGVQ